MDERGYIRSIHTLLPAKVYKWKIHDPNAVGVADAFYSGSNGLVFIEYKYLPTWPKRGSTLINFGLNPAQQHWLTNRFLEGTPVAVVVGSPAGSLILQSGRWRDLVPRDEFDPQLLVTRDVAKWITSTCLGTNATEEHFHAKKDIPAG